MLLTHQYGSLPKVEHASYGCSNCLLHGSLDSNIYIKIPNEYLVPKLNNSLEFYSIKLHK